MEVSVLGSLNPFEQVRAYKSRNISSLETRREFMALEEWMFSGAFDKPLHEVEAVGAFPGDEPVIIAGTSTCKRNGRRRASGRGGACRL